MPLKEGGQGRPTSQGKVGLTFDPSAPPGTESCPDISCSALFPPLEQLSNKVTGHFYRTRRYHSVPEPHVGERAALAISSHHL